MEEPDKKNSDSVNIKTFLCCQEYSKLCSKEKDTNLSFFSKLAKSFHHMFCFTCRRFSKQMSVVDSACKNMLENNSSYLKLSDEAKDKIKSLMK